MIVSITRGFSWVLAIDQLLEAKRVHVSLEGKEVGGFFGFGRGQVDRRSADESAIRAGGVEVRVVWDDVAFLASDIKKDAFRGTALVRGNHVAKSENSLYCITEAREARRTGIGLIAAHHGGPLFGGHGGGAGIGEQVDENLLGIDQKEIVAGRFDQLLALFSRGAPNGLDTLDAEGFDNGSNGHGFADSLLTLAQLGARVTDAPFESHE